MKNLATDKELNNIKWKIYQEMNKSLMESSMITSHDAF
jgi:hypothetical protein